MDQAISDGVDVMSLSLALGHTPLFKDIMAIAALSAIEKGIVVVSSAGNDGPDASTIYNGAPWIMTVSAGTMDRSYIATLELGNGMTFEGTSYFPTSVSITNTSLYYERNGTKTFGCSFLNPNEVKGKLVLCDDTTLGFSEQMDVVRSAGAYGAIFLMESFPRARRYSIPSILLHPRYAKAIREYTITGNKTVVKSMRFIITKMGIEPTPQVAYFSSRGPDPITPNVLKHDILAPGVAC